MMLSFVEVNQSGEIADPNIIFPDEYSEVLTATARLYSKNGFQKPWISYVAVEGTSCLGICAFKTPPVENKVEIAYFTFVENQGSGIGTQMAQHLIDISKSTDPEVKIFAQTLPEKDASTRILEKLGFDLHGTVDSEEDGSVWEWEYKS